jgi:hypothetical protein
MFFQLCVAVAITLLGFSLSIFARYLGKKSGNGKAPDLEKP